MPEDIKSIEDVVKELKRVRGLASKIKKTESEAAELTKQLKNWQKGLNLKGSK